jgi:hypothetical protein
MEPTMFVTEDSVETARGDPSLRWSPFLHGGFRVVRLPGDHYSIWDDPFVGALAAALDGFAPDRSPAGGQWC